MFFSWVRKGLRTGVLTTRYPARPEPMPATFRGRPILDASRCQADQGCTACVQLCLPAALSLSTRLLSSAETGDGDQQCWQMGEDTSGVRQEVTLDYARCIMCGLCAQACPTEALRMTPDYELAVTGREDLRQVVRFSPYREQEYLDGKEQNDGDAC
jgi:formate hydrogenlyase subunit 6